MSYLFYDLTFNNW